MPIRERKIFEKLRFPTQVIRIEITSYFCQPNHKTKKHFINLSPMKNYFILAFCSLFIHVFVFGQKITIVQEQWVRQNYQHIVILKKDSAKIEIKKSFPTASNASVDAMINRATKLMQADKQKHLAQVQQMMRSLTTQKNTLAKETAEKEKELKKTKDPDKIKILKDEITVFKNKIKELDKEIKYLHEQSK